MSPAQIRKISIRAVASLGFPKPPNTLPLSEAVSYIKPISKIIERCACLNAVISCCFGYDAEQALMWLKENNADESLAEEERQFLTLNNQIGLRNELVKKLNIQIEALWALCWSLNLFDQIDWRQYSGENLKSLMPDLEKKEPLQSLEKKSRLRDIKEIIQQEDIAYCLDWAVVEALSKKLTMPGTLRAYAIRERRHALSWLLNEEKWDEISLDT